MNGEAESGENTPRPSRDSDVEENHSHESHTGMGNRGVTRPMAEQEAQPPTGGHSEHEEHDGHAMSHDDRLAMLRMHHRNTLWIPWTIILLGVWVILAPATFGYLNPERWTDPSGGRGAWLSNDPLTAIRAWLMTGSDLACGLILLIFGWRILTPNRPVSWWICCGAGIWLTLAPVLFWAPTVGAYISGTAVGMLVIALTILIPGMPNMVMFMEHGPPRPPGWSYNPSSWPQRWIMIVLGAAGWVVSRYLAAYQLGYIPSVWDPFFGWQSGSKAVLDSSLSHAWPISDASLGAVSYTFEFLMGYMGGPSRWRTMPWMVTLFGILVIPLGLTHILLVSSMPVMVGHWCTFCLLAALIMLPMIPLEVDEVIAMGQHMVEAKRRGDREGSLWRIFWKGGSAEGCATDDRSPELMALPESPGTVFRASIWGMSAPGTLTLSTVLGGWLMFSPLVFGTARPAANVGHLGGALVITASVICMGEVLRAGRYVNIVLGTLIVFGTWMLAGGNTAGGINATVVGLAIAVLAIPRGPKREIYGLWDRFVR